MTGSLASVHPELIPEWSEKNLPLTPDKITFGSNKRVWWKGACGHEWETSVKARSKGEKCPICSGARVIEGINDLATLKPLLAQEWSKKNKLKPTEVSVASHKKIIWKCKHGHEWEASVKSRTVNGTGCPYCSHNKVLAGFNDLASQYPDIAAEWSDRNLPLLPTMVTAFANSKAWWKCKDCGNEWHTLISTRSGGSRCPYCSGYTLLKGFNDLATTHPKLVAEWSERNYPLLPDEVNAKSRRNVWWKCKTCGNEWKSVINARVKGTVCPVCADRTVLAGYNDLATTDRKLLLLPDIIKPQSVCFSYVIHVDNSGAVALNSDIFIGALINIVAEMIGIACCGVSMGIPAKRCGCRQTVRTRNNIAALCVFLYTADIAV